MRSSMRRYCRLSYSSSVEESCLLILFFSITSSDYISCFIINNNGKIVIGVVVSTCSCCIPWADSSMFHSILNNTWCNTMLLHPIECMTRVWPSIYYFRFVRWSHLDRLPFAPYGSRCRYRIICVIKLPRHFSRHLSHHIPLCHLLRNLP